MLLFANSYSMFWGYLLRETAEGTSAVLPKGKI